MNSIKQKHHKKLSYNWEYACEAILTDNYVSILILMIFSFESNVWMISSNVAALFRKQIRPRGVFRTLSNIYEELFFCEIFLLKAVNYFCKKIHMWCFARFGTFVQFKKREKHPWRSVIFSKVAGFLLKVTLLYVCFWRFFNCTWYQIAQRITICLTWS